MLRFRPLIFILLLGFTESVCAQNLKAILKEAPNQEAFWSVTVRDENGDILESIQPEKAIIPASNQKLMTSAALLDYFGSDFRFETPIYGDGYLNENIWEGNLIIKGSGDPSISGDLYEGDRYHVFRNFLNQLKEAGIEHIEGNLMADVSLFDTQYYPKGWDWYDMSFYYGVQISPLSFNNNAVDLEVFAEGEIGSVPEIRWFPDSTAYVHFINQQEITLPGTGYDEYYQREMGMNTIVLGSTLPQGYYEEESLSIHNPPLFFLDSFYRFLTEHGISINGAMVVLDSEASYDTTQVLAKHQSQPLGTMIEWLNKESDNFYTEMLVKTLSATLGNKPGSFEDGIHKIRSFLGDLGIDTSYVKMNDGSGMAGGNFNQTSIISEVLFKMKNHPEFETYMNSMSVAGIDGTLAHRMKGTPLYRNFKGKSGFITGVRTLSGYMTTKSGRELVVSLAANNFISEKVRPIDAIHEEILMYLYETY